MSKDEETERRISALVAQEYLALCEEFAPDALGMALAGIDQCESPIERLLGAALAFGLARRVTSLAGKPWPRFWDDTRDSDLRIEPQKAVDKYRVDFGITYNLSVASDLILRTQLAVECDGHAFHERTPFQASRDKARDRALMTAGWPVLRFAGREIVKDPSACVEQIASALSADHDRQMRNYWKTVEGR